MGSEGLKPDIIYRWECEYCGKSLKIGAHVHGGHTYNPVRVEYKRTGKVKTSKEVADEYAERVLAERPNSLIARHIRRRS